MQDDLKDRLLRYIRFLDIEVSDYPKFAGLSKASYDSDRDLRRNVERWAENIVNSTVDIARIVLTIESIPVPDNYRDSVAALGSVASLGLADAGALSSWVRLRNVLAHEYLDVRWTSLRRFIAKSAPLVRELLVAARSYLARRIEEDRDSSDGSET